MIKALINDAKSAAGSIIAKYLARASVAVPNCPCAQAAVARVAAVIVIASKRSTHTSCCFLDPEAPRSWAR